MFERIIKIPGKSFNDLSLLDVVRLIEADSSLSPGGNEFFSSSALDEFLYCSELTKEPLIQIREDILKNIYIEVPGRKEKEINTAFLKQYAEELKGKAEDSQI